MSTRDWVADCDSLSQMGVAIMEKINERNQQRMRDSNPSKLNSTIRSQLNSFQRELNQLKTSLSKATSSYHITEGEARRRQDKVDNLSARLKQLNEAFREESTSQSRARDSQRSQLIGGRQPMGGSSNPWQEEEESEETRGLTNDEMIVQHQQIMREQDEGLEELSKAVERQKLIGLTIHDEVDRQDEIIDNLGNKVDRTTGRIERETRHVERIRVKASDKGLCCVVVLLLILIVVFLAIPKH
ncbi:syntaxin-8-like [Oscarella lobularis]|uniref:syntaxin-8-like n=1 Tax=Oscarella lobularis TaxID=121494 RepID=UPI003313426D